MYKMWNRITYQDTVIISVYDKNFNLIETIECPFEDVENVPGKWVSPLTIYHKTNGTMGKELTK